MTQKEYLIPVIEPLGPFQNMTEQSKAFEAVGLFNIGYRKNTRHWNVGDLVLHVGDAKRADMLMKVIGFTKDGLVKTKYINPFYENQNPERHFKSTSEIWINEFSFLLDPKDFGIEAI